MKWSNPQWEFSRSFTDMTIRFPIISDMISCPQTLEYHGEGNVWNHTKMVIESMMKDNDFKSLESVEKHILIAAAFFHDIAKPKTFKMEDGKVKSDKHSVLGARMTRETLWNHHSHNYYPAPWDIREYISNLVLLHMLPVHFLNKEFPVFSIGASSQVVSNKHLYILSKADINGRICNENVRQESIDTVELFKDFCIEKECFDGTMKFQSDNARFRYFFEHKGDPCFDYYEPYKGTVVVMSGLPGSGKNYAINRDYPSLPVVGYDDMREEIGLKYGEDESLVQTNVKERIKVHMRDNQDFVFNATNVIKDIRSQWIRRFRLYGYRIKIHYVEKSLKETLENNKKRDIIVPENIIIDKFAKLDIPTLMECHEIKYETKE